MITLEHVQKRLAIAHEWLRKNERAHAHFCMRGALCDYLSLATRRTDDGQEAADWLRANAVAELLERCRENLTLVCAEVDAGRLAETVIGGNYYHFILSGMASCLGMFALSEWFVEIAARPGVLGISTPFWREYSRGACALVSRNPYRVAELGRLRRMEAYWMPYLQLMSAASVNEPLSPALDGIAKSFVKRNRDKKIIEPSFVDGCGDDPVRWDFRRDGLVAYIAHTRPGLVQ